MSITTEAKQRSGIIHSCIGMDMTGHTTLAWDADDDAHMLPMIRRGLEEGRVFYIVRRNPLREEQLRRVEDIGDQRHVVLRTEESRRLFEEGIVAIADDADEDEPIETVRRTRDAEEIARSDTIAHRPHRGG